MMRVAIVAGLLAIPGVAVADAASPDDGAATARAPSRPLAVTPAQYSALKALERQAVHQTCRDVPASYSSETVRLADDVTHIGTLVGLPTGFLIALIFAAPL